MLIESALYFNKMEYLIMMRIQRHKINSLAYACLMGFASTSAHAGSIEEAKAFIMESFNNCKIGARETETTIGWRMVKDFRSVVTFPTPSTIKVVEQYIEYINVRDGSEFLTEKKYISQANLADLNPDSVVFKNGALTIECSKAKCFNVAEYHLSDRRKYGNQGDLYSSTVDPNKNQLTDSQTFRQNYRPCDSSLGPRAAKAFSDLIRLSGGKASAY